jgi:hypothetical protein
MASGVPPATLVPAGGGAGGVPPLPPSGGAPTSATSATTAAALAAALGAPPDVLTRALSSAADPNIDAVPPSEDVFLLLAKDHAAIARLLAAWWEAVGIGATPLALGPGAPPGVAKAARASGGASGASGKAIDFPSLLALRRAIVCGVVAHASAEESTVQGL